ncbi:MAG: hypothetical protein HJJLKODD_02824 [Phycisphaerae bacterium]|nr:hypothetical protein [Phycisphaerae bacterium]
MNRISEVQPGAVERLIAANTTTPTSRTKSSTNSASSVPAIEDRVEISELSQMLSLSQNQSDVRAEKVADIRRQLSENEDKFIRERLAGTVDRIWQELNG